MVIGIHERMVRRLTCHHGVVPGDVVLVVLHRFSNVYELARSVPVLHLHRLGISRDHRQHVRCDEDGTDHVAVRS